MRNVLRRQRAHAVLLGIGVVVSSIVTTAQQPPTPSVKEQAAAKLFAAGQWTEAAAAYRELVGVEPQNPRAAFGLGAALHDGGHAAEAIEPFLKARALGYLPINQVRFRLARAYAKSGDPAKALAMLDELIANNFSNAALLPSPDLGSLPADRLASFVNAVNSRAHPCGADPNYRKFDFWIGVWDVQPTGAPRAPVGATSRIERQLDGCVILENWEPPAGVPGKSFNICNRATQKWEQYWTDARGTITHYVGVFKEDGNLYYEADQFGTGSKIRMTFFNQGPDQVRQLGQTSTDGGKTWAVSYDLTYVRKKI
jgi:tetratricopeptide (TPR) repeat protein